MKDIATDLALFYEQGDQIHLSMDTNDKNLYKLNNKIERLLRPFSMKEVILLSLRTKLIDKWSLVD